MSASGVGLRFERDVAAGVVVDLGQRAVDAPMRSLIVSRHIASCALKFATSRMVFSLSNSLKRNFEARQVVGLQLVEHRPVLADRLDGDIDFLRVERKGEAVGAHRVDDLVAQRPQLVVAGIDPL
jgi:hypothetical protein